MSARLGKLSEIEKLMWVPSVLPALFLVSLALFHPMAFSKKTLIIVNAVLVILLIGVCWHEQYFKRFSSRLVPQKASIILPENNTLFNEQTDFYAVYKLKPAVVMLGTSHTYKMAWNELLNRTDIVNRGVNGDITAGILLRASNVVSMQPKLCFIEGGINDIDLKIPLDTIIRNLFATAILLKNHTVLPVMTSITYVASVYPDYLTVNNKIDSVNRKIQAFTLENHLIYLNTNILLSKNGSLASVYSRHDGCHLNSAAYVLWGNRVNSVINQVLGK